MQLVSKQVKSCYIVSQDLSDMINYELRRNVVWGTCLLLASNIRRQKFLHMKICTFHWNGGT